MDLHRSASGRVGAPDRPPNRKAAEAIENLGLAAVDVSITHGKPGYAAALEAGPTGRRRDEILGQRGRDEDIDRRAVMAGIPVSVLMENAGRALSVEALEMIAERCGGPGRVGGSRSERWGRVVRGKTPVVSRPPVRWFCSRLPPDGCRIQSEP